jgi:hypothetical protein
LLEVTPPTFFNEDKGFIPQNFFYFFANILFVIRRDLNTGPREVNGTAILNPHPFRLIDCGDRSRRLSGRLLRRRPRTDRSNIRTPRNSKGCLAKCFF